MEATYRVEDQKSAIVAVKPFMDNWLEKESRDLVIPIDADMSDSAYWERMLRRSPVSDSKGANG